jgi:hypothetical protein
MPFFGVNLHGLERHGEVYVDDDGKVFLALPERLPFMDRDDTGIHIAQGDETLMDIATLHYKGAFKQPLDLVEVLAQFQEHTVVDFSIPLASGTVVLLPSMEYITDIAFGDSLLEFAQV